MRISDWSSDVCSSDLNIFEPDHANSILAGGRADLVALVRPHLIDPSWTLRAAAGAGYRGVTVPKPYVAGMAQLGRNLARADRKSGGEGTSVSGRVDLVGRRIIKKQN